VVQEHRKLQCKKIAVFLSKISVLQTLELKNPKHLFLMRKTDFWRPIFDKETPLFIFDKEDRFFDKEDRNPVPINHQETVQIAVKHSEETGPIPDCSFYLAVLMSGCWLREFEKRSDSDNSIREKARLWKRQKNVDCDVVNYRDVAIPVIRCHSCAAPQLEDKIIRGCHNWGLGSQRISRIVGPQ